MKKTFYIQIDEVNRVTDIIEKPYEGYKEISLNVPLPYGILNGSYKLLNDEVIYIPEWDKSKLQDEVNELKNKLKVTTKAMDEIILNNMEVTK